MSVQLLRRSFTVEDYHRMARAGILREDDRVELLDGEILEMTPIGSRHAACVDRLNQLFSDQMRRRAIVRIQNPIRLSERSEPQPDVALLRPRPDFYAQAQPGPGDVLLVVEVADLSACLSAACLSPSDGRQVPAQAGNAQAGTSAELDRDVKVPLYARAGIAEVWLLDLAGECIEVFQRPTPQGYQEVRRVRRGDRLVPHAFPDIEFVVDEFIG